MLGYTQVSWDNDSGEELQPWSLIKSWASLSANEKIAASFLGYSQKSWDNESGLEPQPPSVVKSWDEQSVCGKNMKPPLPTVTRCLSTCLLHDSSAI